MKYFSMLALGSLALLAASPAYAGVTIDEDGAGPTFSLSNLTVNTPYTIDFDGYGGTPATVVGGLTSRLILTLTGTTSWGAYNTYDFNYSITNTSSSPVTASRVSAFGFNSAPDLYNTPGKNNNSPPVYTPYTNATGVFPSLTVNTNFPNFPNNVEICFSDSNNCPGGGGGGILFGQTAGGTLHLAYASNVSSVALTDFVVRYQSIAGVTGVSSAIGRPTTPPGVVPEPAAWAMMLIGFGMVGAFMRSSKGANVRTRIAFN